MCSHVKDLRELSYHPPAAGDTFSYIFKNEVVFGALSTDNNLEKINICVCVVCE